MGEGAIGDDWRVEWPAESSSVADEAEVECLRLTAWSGTTGVSGSVGDSSGEMSMSSDGSCGGGGGGIGLVVDAAAGSSACVAMDE